MAQSSRKSGDLTIDTGRRVTRKPHSRPQTLRRIWLVFEDNENARTQEFVLRGHGARNLRFAKSYGNRGILLELIIVPDKSGGDVRIPAEFSGGVTQVRLRVPNQRV